MTCTKITIKHTADDVPPYITGITTKANGELIFVDNIHNSIVLLDSTMAVKDTMNLTRGVVEGTRKPYDVALVNDTEVIVTYPGPRLLQFVKISPHLEAGETVDLNKDIWGVEVSNKNIYVTCGGEKPEIVVLDLKGELQDILDIRTIDPDFGSPRYIAANLEGTRLYLTCSEKLLCMTVTGELLFSSASLQPDGIGGVTVDEENNAYVCSHKTNTILKFNSDGSLCKALLTSDDGLKWPKSTCYRSMDRLLYVGGNMKELFVCELE